MHNLVICTTKRFRLIVAAILVMLSLIALAQSALAEYIDGVPIWNGITGMANTFGTRGVGCPSSGVAYSYTHSTDNIYYQEVYLKEISTFDYTHVINSSLNWRYYQSATPQVSVPWDGCNYIYVVSRHIWRSAPNNGPTRYTSGDGTKSNFQSWNYQ
jgi:hypothetical protein